MLAFTLQCGIQYSVHQRFWHVQFFNAFIADQTAYGFYCFFSGPLWARKASLVKSKEGLSEWRSDGRYCWSCCAWSFLWQRLKWWALTALSFSLILIIFGLELVLKCVFVCQTGGIMSSFLMGCYDPESKKWCTVTKCSGGYDDATLARLQKELDVIKIGKVSLKT